MNIDKKDGSVFPVTAGILLSQGLGGFFYGIVLHQILQWHHRLIYDSMFYGTACSTP